MPTTWPPWPEAASSPSAENDRGGEAFSGTRPHAPKQLGRPEISPLFTHALAYACTVHDGQFRKGSHVPYVAHLLAVAALALEFGATETEAIAALLHDAAEDAGGRPRLDHIRAAFGHDVALIVEGCTDTLDTPKPPWRPRKEQYLRHLRHAPRSVALVSACDKLHNLRSIVADLRILGNATFEKFNGGRDGTLWYYESLVQEYHRRGDLPPPLLDELSRTIAELRQLAS